MSFKGVNFSITSHAAWAPRVETNAAWLAWANGNHVIAAGMEPRVHRMPAMLRRRAGFLGKMALEVAYQCLGESTDVATVFSSRHGEASRSVDLLLDLVQGVPLSPTAFGLSVHNATGGLFSIARGDRANNIAIAAGHASVEHAVIEACGLLADGEPAVLLVVYDCPLPSVYSCFEDCREQPYAWAWLMQPPARDVVSLTWSGASENGIPSPERLPAGLEVFRFYLRKDRGLERTCDQRRWLWSRDV